MRMYTILKWTPGFVLSFLIWNSPAFSKQTSWIITENKKTLNYLKQINSSPIVVARTLALQHTAIYFLLKEGGLSKREGQNAGKWIGNYYRRPLESPSPAALKPSEKLASFYVSEFEAWRSEDLSLLDSAGKLIQQPTRKSKNFWQAESGSHPLHPAWGMASSFLSFQPWDWLIQLPKAPTPTLSNSEIRDTLSIGSENSKTRTTEQSVIARFWEQGVGTVTPPGQWNQIAARILGNSRLSDKQIAKLFAEMNLGMVEVSIHCWANKYDQLMERPNQVARRLGITNWRALLATPPHPEFPSGHSSFSMAAAVTLETRLKEYGLAIRRLDILSDDLPGMVRSFTSFKEAAVEAGLSRIYGGIHFPISNRNGQKLGQEIGERVLIEFLE